MKQINSLLLFLLYFFSGYAQVGGVSGSKINAVNHAPIAVGLAEFEPSYNYLRTHEYWNDEGKLENIFSTSDSLLIRASINLRIAYTFTEALEFGCNLGVDYSNWSFKYALHTDKKLGIGLLAGANFPFGNTIVDKTRRSAAQIGTYGFGAIASYEFDEQSSLDFNVQIQEYFQKNDELPNADMFLYLDYGHYYKDFFLLASVSYQQSFGDIDQHLLTFYPGVSIEMKPEYLIVLNGVFDILGRNIERTQGLSIAFTITL